jgi:hypothetical protein
MNVTKHPVRACLVAAGVLFAMPGLASAQQASLTLVPSAITFPPADPDSFPVVTAAPVTITYLLRGVQGPWQLTVLASGDLTAGTATIVISNVSWVATPTPPLQNGTLSKTIAQVVASGTGQVNPAATGTLTFRLANSWNYSSGTYTQTIVFTLSAP